MSKKQKREWTKRPWRKFLTDNELAVHDWLSGKIATDWRNPKTLAKLRAARKLIQNRATMRAGRAGK